MLQMSITIRILPYPAHENAPLLPKQLFRRTCVSTEKLTAHTRNRIICLSTHHRNTLSYLLPKSEAHRPGPVSLCPDSDILALGWVAELAGVDSERAWYARIKAKYGTLFPHLPSLTRFNRRRRQLCAASEMCRGKLVELLPAAAFFLVDRFPMLLCDFKRAHGSTSA